MANALQYETSPYLLQHKNNPVDWLPWDEKYLQKAQEEDKLILVSIGYSACHWCHVMEHEVFEDETCAHLMNMGFINIKVDREERPDIDHVYMSALQLMTGSGGWPLNCILLPDGRPVYGGTYFPKEKWMQTLNHLTELWKNDREKMLEYADKLNQAMKSDFAHGGGEMLTDTTYGKILESAVTKWQKSFDADFGGPRRAPKFPLPNNYAFLMRYALAEKNEDVMQHVVHTLKMMAYGGIYDQVGGGFARYSVDQYWKVPHFEKMLYDNAQLIGLYAEAYALFDEKVFAETAHETITFCKRELLAPEGGWYSALDADSEGVEGKFYIWKIEELKDVLGGDFEIAQDYYNVNAEGYWEDDNYILLRQTDDDIFARKHELDLNTWTEKRERIKERLLERRNGRTRPGTDDKILLSWNAMMVTGLCKAYRYTRKCGYLDLAQKTWTFLEENMLCNGRWMRTYKNGEAKIPAFLEDYAFLAEAALQLSEVALDITYAEKAEQICAEAIRLFWDEEKELFRFRANTESALAVETYEVQDNVIPAANSQMANNLFVLSRIGGDIQWENMAIKMAEKILPSIENYGPGYSNWCTLLQNISNFTETVFVGESASNAALDFMAKFTPANYTAASQTESSHVLFNGRFVSGKTLRYDCKNHACQLPQEV